MSGKSNFFENALLLSIFNNVGNSILGPTAQNTLWVALHTASPDEIGTQNAFEATYTGYARVGVERTTQGWVVTNNSASPAMPINFPEATGGSSTITHFSIGLSQTGPGSILYYGSVTPIVTVTEGILPRLKTDSVVIEN